MTVYRPTTLRLAAEHCSKALDHYEDGVTYDRRIFATGTAAHCYLQALGDLCVQLGKYPGRAAIAALFKRVTKSLISEGRSFEGVQEPPLPHDKVFAGRGLVMAWLQQGNQLSPGAEYEVGIAVGDNWEEVDYGPDAYYRCILDVVEITDVEDEEFCGRMIRITDYKTDWPADESRLDSVQMKSQAVLANIKYPDWDLMTRQVVNLRTGAIYEHHLYPDEGLLERWQEDLQETIAAEEAKIVDGSRVASPGAECNGCPYALSCDDASDLLADFTLKADPASMARSFAILSARREVAKEGMKLFAKEDPVDIGSAVVGTVAAERVVLKKDSAIKLWELWEKSGGEPRGFVNALDLSVAQAKRALAKLESDADAWLAKHTERLTSRRFGVHRKD